MTDEERRGALVETLRRRNRPGTLARACLIVARGEFPHLDVTVPLAEITRLAGLVRQARAAAGSDAAWRVLRDVLHRKERFSGNTRSHDHPDNSYLNRVLERRRGLPILLSILWVEVARAAGIAAEGVGLPGHFLATVGEAPAHRLVDPFAGGAALAEPAALARATEATGQKLPDPTWLDPVPPARIMARVLENLAGSYARRGSTDRLLRVLSDQLALDPANPAYLVRRATVLESAGEVSGALDDLNRALAATPPGPAWESLRETAARLARQRLMEN